MQGEEISTVTLTELMQWQQEFKGNVGNDTLMKAKQKNCSRITHIKAQVRERVRLQSLQDQGALSEHQATRLGSLMKTIGNYEIAGNVLFYVTQDLIPRRLIVPAEEFYEEILQQAHVHTSKAKTLGNVMKKFYWPGLARAVKRHLSKCECIRFRQGGRDRSEKKGIYRTSIPNCPFAEVQVDVLVLEGNKRDSRTEMRKGVLVIVDSFSGFVALKPLEKSPSAAEVAKLLVETFAIMGIPSRIRHGRGSEFQNKTMKLVTNVLGIADCPGSSGNSRAQAKVERANLPVNELLSFLYSRQGQWQNHLDLVQWKINTSVNPNTGLSPYQIVFGREPRMPALNAEVHEDLANFTVEMYEKLMKERLADLHERIRCLLHWNADRTKEHYMTKVNAHKFKLYKVLSLPKSDRGRAGNRFYGQLLKIVIVNNQWKNPENVIGQIRYQGKNGERLTYRRTGEPVRVELNVVNVQSNSCPIVNYKLQPKFIDYVLSKYKTVRRVTKVDSFVCLRRGYHRLL
eukprot:g2448.t1